MTLSVLTQSIMWKKSSTVGNRATPDDAAAMIGDRDGDMDGDMDGGTDGVMEGDMGGDMEGDMGGEGNMGNMGNDGDAAMMRWVYTLELGRRIGRMVVV